MPSLAYSLSLSPGESFDPAAGCHCEKFIEQGTQQPSLILILNSLGFYCPFPQDSLPALSRELLVRLLPSLAAENLCSSCDSC